MTVSRWSDVMWCDVMRSQHLINKHLGQVSSVFLPSLPLSQAPTFVLLQLNPHLCSKIKIETSIVLIEYSFQHKNVVFPPCLASSAILHEIGMGCVQQAWQLLQSIHCRGSLYRFDDFLTAWSEKLRAKEPTSMTVRLQKDVDKYKVHVHITYYMYIV